MAEFEQIRIDFMKTRPGKQLRAIQRRMTPIMERRTTTQLMVAAVVMVVLIGFLDYLTGLDITSSLFYLVPILMVTRFVRPMAGIAMSVLSVISIGLSGALRNGFEYEFGLFFWHVTVPLVFFVVFVVLLTLLMDSMRREQELSRTDGLTGLLNWRHFTSLASAELERARRYNHPVSIAYIDLDNFKEVNDRFGHAEGDAVLQAVAGLLTGNLRATDRVARLGGDEFAVLLPETGGDAASTVMLDVKESLLREMEGRGWPVTASIGVATFEALPGTVDEMIGHADRLMYSVKAKGKADLVHEVV
ncbi:MAG: GGDEF domain-containing protein [Actinobacteria bacterium]|nr:GGDEF domain-containing protein [Actinomycetota bacterium]MBU1944218.1 GGDEF domain-containing protein [Actinomycetota bacterium]MBU2688389.1 GGDEF domain-containing protein [Actinomycetota bacterium]